MNRKFHDIEQNSEGWSNARIGKITASNFPTIMANEGKAFGEPAKKYAMRIALEETTGVPVETFKNAFMDRGHELEPQARSLYEDTTMNAVSNGGFMEYEKYGASSDGLIGDDEMIEIKSVIYSTHFKNIEKNYDKSYYWQMLGNLWVYDRKVCHFVSYCPEFTGNKKLHVFPVERNKEDIKRLRIRLGEFEGLIEKYRGIL